MIEREKKVQSKENPKLLAKDFYCEGSDVVGCFPTDPEIHVAGATLKYVTLTARNSVVENMSKGLRGCIYFAAGKCSVGGGECPVASVVSIKEFHERVEELKKLKYVPS